MVYVLTLAGGQGSRLWPLSTEDRPKQCLSFQGPEETSDNASLLIQTITRCQQLQGMKGVYLSIGMSLLPSVTQALRQGGLTPMLGNLICEPVSRNTAPAILLGAQMIREQEPVSPDDVLVILPSDHHIEAQSEFLQILERGIALAKDTHQLVIFGIKPTFPETAYGYIEVEPTASQMRRLSPQPAESFAVKRFVEKPDRHTAEHYLETGAFYWNAGIFVTTFKALFEAYQTAAPEIHNLVQTGYAQAYQHYAQMPSISFDYAIMEKIKNRVVVEMDIPWRDLGSWDSVYEHLTKDNDHNVKVGDDIHTHNTAQTLIWSDTGRFISTIGLEDFIVVDTDQALLIAKRGDSQQVRESVKVYKQTCGLKPEKRMTLWGELEPVLSQAVYQPDSEAPMMTKITLYPGHTVTFEAIDPVCWSVMSGQGFYDQTKPIEPLLSWLQAADSKQVVTSDSQASLVLIALSRQCPQVVESPLPPPSQARDGVRPALDLVGLAQRD